MFCIMLAFANLSLQSHASAALVLSPHRSPVHRGWRDGGVEARRVAPHRGRGQLASVQLAVARGVRTERL